MRHYLPFPCYLSAAGAFTHVRVVSVAVLSSDELLSLLALERRSLVGFLTLITGDRQDADDLYQEVALEALRIRPTFEAGTNFGAWVRAIARLQALRHRRAAGRRRSVALSSEVIEQLAQEWEEESDDREPALRACVQELEAEPRRLLSLRYAAGLPLRRIAAEAGRSEDALKVQLSRLRKRLQACVEGRLKENE